MKKFFEPRIKVLTLTLRHGLCLFPGDDEMEYTVQKLARLAGISARTIRYYDSIGLLRPARVTSSGYRIYGGREVDRLQQILLLRALDMPLDEIARTLGGGYDEIGRAHV